MEQPKDVPAPPDLPPGAPPPEALPGPPPLAGGAVTDRLPAPDGTAITAVPPLLPVAPPVPAPPAHRGFWLGLLAVAVIYAGLWFAGPEAQKVAIAGSESLPFLGLALLATLGLRHLWGQVFTIVYWVLLVGALGASAWFLTFLAVADPVTFSQFGEAHKGLGGKPNLAKWLPPGSLPPLVLSFLGIGLGAGLGFLGFLPAVRRACARFLPIDPRSFVHATALATVVAFTLICFVPLLALGQPPLLLLLQHHKDNKEMADELSRQQQLRDQLYGLVWLVPAAVVAAGCPLRRTVGQALERVGLVRPTALQVYFGVVAAVVLVGLMPYADAGIGWVWQRLGWPATDTRTFSELMQFAINFWGAVVIGVTAGLGEELAVRGVLQPRLGIVASNLFFTALHAFQYNFDGLLSVFLVGLILGLIRKGTNTTTSAIVHGLYDFLLVLLTYLKAPGFR